MPVLLDPRVFGPELAGCESVLIVPCRFCPAASAAVRNDEPYLQFPLRGLKTDAYERQIRATREELESAGLRVGVFRSRLLHQFVLCMWTARRRARLREVARAYQAVVVLGCDAAAATVREVLQGTTCRVIPGMEAEGIMSICPRFSLPCKVSLDLESVTPMLEPGLQS